MNKIREEEGVQADDTHASQQALSALVDWLAQSVAGRIYQESQPECEADAAGPAQAPAESA